MDQDTYISIRENNNQQRDRNFSNGGQSSDEKIDKARMKLRRLNRNRASLDMGNNDNENSDRNQKPIKQVKLPPINKARV